MEKITLPNGQILNAHSKKSCAGRYCCLHNPRDHHMKDWPLNWRGDTGVMERICPHGIGHPDPDHLAHVEINLKGIRNYDGIHGCDGCCNPERKGT